MNKKIKVLAVHGMSYSGSTLLSLMLDTHSAIYGGGELHWLLERKKKKLDFYSGCAHCFENCKFWTHENMEGINEKKFYAHISNVFKKKIILDASKMPDWFEYIKNEQIESAVEFVDILLIKHPLRQLASIISNIVFRQLQDLSKIEGVFYDEMEKWIRRCSKFYEPFFQTVGSEKRQFTFLLRYEDLVLSPEQALFPLLKSLGIGYESKLKNCYDFPHHIIGGNAGASYQILKTWVAKKEETHPIRKKQYQNHRGVFLDNKYREIFSPGQLEWLRNHDGVQKLNDVLGYRHI